METALFYTFSTIAQTLAGAIALLGAFVLYRLQSFNADIEEQSLSVIQLYDDATKTMFVDLHVRGQYERVYRLFAERPPSSGVTEYVKLTREKLGILLAQKRSVSRYFIVSLVLTIGLIVMSVVVLALTPAIARCPAGPVLTFGSGVAWFVACVVSYALLVRKVLIS